MDLKNEYTKLLATSISVSIEDLTDNEQKLIDKSFDLFKEKIVNQIVRPTIEGLQKDSIPYQGFIFIGLI